MSWALFAAIPFLVSIGLLGFALANQVMLEFAIGWPAFQIFGYVGALSLAKGNPAHFLFKSQTMLHFMVMALLIAILVKAV